MIKVLDTDSDSNDHDSPVRGEATL